MIKQPSYKFAFISSLAFHALLFALLVLVPMHAEMPRVAVNNNVKIVKAVTVNQAVVEKEIANIKAAQAKKHELEQARLKQLQQQAIEAKEERERELAKLAKMRLEKQKIQQEITKKKQLALKQQRDIQKRKQEAAQQAKLAAKKAAMKTKKALEARRLAAEKLKLAQQTLFKQQLKQEQKQISAARAKQQQSEIDKYKALIVQTISQNWLVPDNVNKDLSSELLIHVGPGGDVLGVQILRSSGNAALDNSARTAVFKSSPLPVPKNPELFDKFRQLKLTVKPEKIIAG